MFLGELLGFFISLFFSFLRVFIFSCFHFFMFSFLQMFLLSMHFLTSLCFFTAVFAAIASATDLKEVFFTLRQLFTLQPFLLLLRLPWVWQFSVEGCKAFYWSLKHRPNPSICLNHAVFGNYMISRKLYLNLSKYVDKLLMVKSLINVKHIIIWWIVFKRNFINFISMRVILSLYLYDN